MSSTPKAKTNSGAAGTVLLRQAQPKYNFQGRKLPKETPGNKNNSDSSSDAVIMSSQSLSASNSMRKGGKPVAVVGAQTNSSSEKSHEAKTQLVAASPISSVSSMPNLTPGTNSSASGYIPGSGHVAGSDSSKDSHSSLGMSSNQRTSLPVSASFSSQPDFANMQNSNSTVRQATMGTGDSLPSLEASHAQTLAVQVLQNVHSGREQLEAVERERDSLKKDLEVQLQVNAELKKLLVASVGEDLSQRVERLARDRAQLSMDIGGFSKKMSEDHENFDKVSIQADMWRSKYLASRVMVEELGNARAYYALQSHDAQDALQQMLNERHELRTNLLENYKVLQQVKNAFDPLNSQRSSSLASTNVLDLSRACQQLSEAVRFRLLPAHVAVPVGTEGDEDLWENAVTRAEQYAHVVLSRPCEPVGSIQSGSSHLLPVMGSNTQGCQINRFHPHTRHENLTFNCCTKCKGDINVL
ncbi:golgin-45 [Aplysia californica]|uniref:Golgin-45 n=1 Tax=Aplysia californica TaxID=6500 RepID=A0ABM0JVM0_APLCA|nr:golgin-45 [Aplysia californica]